MYEDKRLVIEVLTVLEWDTKLWRVIHQIGINWKFVASNGFVIESLASPSNRLEGAWVRGSGTGADNKANLVQGDKWFGMFREAIRECNEDWRQPCGIIGSNPNLEILA